MTEKEEDLSAHVAARGMLSISAKDITSTVSAVVFFVLIARHLPNIDDVGFLTGLQTLILMFILLSGLGLPNSATRFISTYIGSGKSEKANLLYPLVFIISIATSAAFSFLMYSFSPLISATLFHGLEYSSLLQMASIDVFLSSMILTCIFLLYAYKQYAKVASFSIINSIIKFSLAFVLFINGWGLYGIVVGLIIGDAIALLLFILILAPKILVKGALSIPSIRGLKPLFAFSLPLYGSLILNFVSSRVDVYFLMALSTLYIVGIYSPALFVANTFLLLLVAIDQALLPATARIFGKSGLANFKNVCRSSSRYLFLFYLPLGIAVAVSAPSLIVIVMGERFADSSYPVTIIVIGITLTSPVIIFNNLLRSAGYSGFLLKNESISITVQILMLSTFIPIFGMLGAAFAKSFSRVVYLIYPTAKLMKLGALDIDKRALRNGLVASCSIGILIIIINMFVTEPLYNLPIAYVLSFGYYLLFLRATHSLDEQDIELVDKVLSGKMKWVKACLMKIVIG